MTAAVPLPSYKLFCIVHEEISNPKEAKNKLVPKAEMNENEFRDTDNKTHLCIT